ncbi:SH3 domain-containing protein [Brevundimonas naejangsanensis]|uniref:SH3 domain-containing protein n=1 Tax=Brevundimonas naejangsanensis TaxID=588932 RepID=UPI0039F6B1B2
MANNNAAGCGGWIVALLLGIGLLSQCGKDDAPRANSGSSINSLASMPTETPSRYMYVQANTLNCRAEPSASSPIVAKLSVNDQVPVLEDRDGWSLAKRSENCWVRTSYLAASRKYIPPPRATPQRSYSGTGSSRSTSRRSYGDAGICPCRGNNVCIGPRGGRYCITSGGNKRYGV